VPDDLLALIESGDLDGLRRRLAADPQDAAARDEAGVPYLMHALYRRQIEIAGAFVEAGAPVDVFAAAALGDGDRLAALLAAEPESVSAYSPDGFTALHLAAFFDRPDCAALLVERGADVAAVARNSMQVMPLHSAAAVGSVEVVRLLLHHGAPADATQEGGYTPLQAAAANGDAGSVTLLLGHGADAARANDRGETAVTLARERGYEALAELLES